MWLELGNSLPSSLAHLPDWQVGVVWALNVDFSAGLLNYPQDTVTGSRVSSQERPEQELLCIDIYYRSLLSID